MFSRRRFMQLSGGAAALLAMRRRALAFSQSAGLTKFRPDWPLQGLGPTGIPVAASDGTVNFPGGIVATHYTIDMAAYTQELHPELGGKTRLWGYGQNGNHRHLGGVIVAQKNKPIQIRFNNKLTTPHPVGNAIDRSAYFMDMQYEDTRVSVHLHGGLTPWVSDGMPESYFGVAGGIAGPTYAPDMKHFVGDGLNPVPGGSLGYGDYYYTNSQSSRLVWYHDHAMDLTRVNAYGGLASAYIIRDDLENSLIRTGALPGREVPLVFQDKTFNSDGSLWYPTQYEANQDNAGTNQNGRWERGPQISGYPVPVEPSCVPEFFGDTILCNGTAYPSFNVSANRYRFRVLNAFQGRFMNLTMWVLPDGATELPLRDDGNGPVLTASPFVLARNMVPDTGVQPGPKIIQIGNEAGFLQAPVTFAGNTTLGFDQNPANLTLNNVNRKNLLLAPAERADLLIDFSGFAGKTIVLWSDAPAPFPGGDPRNDYFHGQEDFTTSGANSYGLSGGVASPVAGHGPNTRTLLQFTVGPSAGKDMNETAVLAILTAQMAKAFTPFVPPPGTPIRELTLNEDFDAWGRLTQRLGTADIRNQPVIAGNMGQDFNVTPINASTCGMAYLEKATEVVHQGDTEVWRIWNLTGDTHPIHFHLVNVQVLSRETFDGVTPVVGKSLAPLYQGVDANERGWKETVRINPMEAISVIMKFDLPSVPFTQPLSTRAGTAPAHEYVWHCHILEHEEHDMMRPLIVIPK
jgi:spore coat protein A